MSPRRIHLGPIQEAEIKDLQQEIIRLKRRLSRLERKKDLRPFARDFAVRPEDDQISSTHEDVFEGPPRRFSTPPSREFNFEEFEDPLSKSPSFPLYDEPVFDEYDDDDMFFEVLDLEQPTYDNYDMSKTNFQPKLFAHNVPKVIEKAEVAPPEAMEVRSTGNVEIVGEGVTELKEGGYVLPIFTGECKENVHCIGMGTVGLGAAEGARIGVPSKGIPSAYATLKKLKIGRQFDIGWIYPDRFSQPNPPPYCGQPDIFL